MAIITISRQLGSQGTEVAQLLAKQLNYNILDRAALEPMMADEGITEPDKYDERKPGIWDTVTVDTFRYIHALQTVLYRHAQQGNCIIIGRGSQFMLRRIPGVLKVNIIAPFVLRVKRIRERYNCEIKDAEMQVLESDQERKGFHRFFFDIDWEAPDLYDLVLNTKIFSPTKSMEFICDALEAVETPKIQEETDIILKDFRLSQEVIKNIRCTKRIHEPYLSAHVHDGVVTLDGGLLDKLDIDLCEHAALEVPGVKKVINKTNFINPWGIA